MDKQKLKQEVIISRPFVGRTEYYAKMKDIYKAVRKDKLPRIVSFSGCGGIGKTRLMEQLCKFFAHELDANITLPNEKLPYICIELTENSNKVNILDEMRYRINSLYGGEQFKTFSAAHKQYTGYQINVEQSSQSVFLSGFNLFKEVAPKLPHVGPFCEFFKIVIDNGVPVFQSILNSITVAKEKDLLESITQMSHNTLYQNMHYFFIYDMCKLMKQQGKPLTIFLDNYEAYHKGLAHASNFDDKWLRESIDALMQRIPNIVWVVFGREPLKWNESTVSAEVYEETLAGLTIPKISVESKVDDILANISESEEYLYESLNMKKDEDKEVTDLITALSVKSEGLPLLLELYVDTYRNAEPHTLTIETFQIDKQQLHKRYFRYIENNVEYRDGVMFLACISNWHDEEAKAIGRDFMYNPYRWGKTYDVIKHISFIKYIGTKDNKKDTSRYSFYEEDIRDMFREEAGIEMLCEVNWRVLNYRLKQIDKNVDDDIFAESVADIVDAFVNIPEIYPKQTTASEKNLEKVFYEVVAYISQVSIRDSYESALKLAKKVEMHCEESNFKNTVFDVLAKMTLAKCQEGIGDWLSALEVITKVYKFLKSDTEVVLPAVLEMESSLEIQYITLLEKCNKYQEAFETLCVELENDVQVDKKSYKIKCEKQVVLDSTLALLGLLARLYTKNYYFQEALEICKFVEDKCNRDLEKHMYSETVTLKAVNSIIQARNELACGNTEKAYEIANENLEKVMERWDMLEACDIIIDCGKDYSLEKKKQYYEKKRLYLGEEHPETIEICSKLASVYILEEEYAKALEQYVTATALADKIFGETNWVSLECYYNLGRFIFDLSRKSVLTEESKRIEQVIKKSISIETTALHSELCYLAAYEISANLKSKLDEVIANTKENGLDRRVAAVIQEKVEILYYQAAIYSNKIEDGCESVKKIYSAYERLQNLLSLTKEEKVNYLQYIVYTQDYVKDYEGTIVTLEEIIKLIPQGDKKAIPYKLWIVELARQGTPIKREQVCKYAEEVYKKTPKYNHDGTVNKNVANIIMMYAWALERMRAGESNKTIKVIDGQIKKLTKEAYELMYEDDPMAEKIKASYNLYHS